MMRSFTLILFLNFVALACFGQKNVEKLVEKGDFYYKNLKYHKAIPFYKEAIIEKEKHTLSIRTKLAYCYRMLNQMDAAELLYSEIVTEEQAKGITYYYYGEALMSNGKYDEAKQWFMKYDEFNPKDTRALTMAEACERAKKLQPYFPDITLSRMPFNSEGDDYAPLIYNDGLLFVSDHTEEGDNNNNNEYDWTGRAFSSIYFADADSASLFSAEALPFSRKFNKREKNSGPATLSGNGKYLFFSRNSDLPNSTGNKYMMAIYVAEKGAAGWKTPVLLEVCNPNFNFMHPAASFTDRKSVV